MILCDVNVLVYAFIADSENHRRFRTWLQNKLESPEAFGASDLVFSGFLRIVTHPRIFKQPVPLAKAMEFIMAVKSSPSYVPVSPGPRHWDIFMDLCKRANAKGNIIPDAFLAALAIESGCLWITCDRGFGRFPLLKWKHPLD